MDHRHSQYVREKILQRIQDIVESCKDPDIEKEEGLLVLKWYIYLVSMYSTLGQDIKKRSIPKMIDNIREAVRSTIKDGKFDYAALISDMAESTFQMYFHAQSRKAGGSGLN